MVTREDAIGVLNVIPEPGQPFSQAATQLSIPHLPRLDAIAQQLQGLIQPIVATFTAKNESQAPPIANYSPAPSQLAALFPNCEEVIPSSTDFNLFNPAISEKNNLLVLP